MSATPDPFTPSEALAGSVCPRDALRIWCTLNDREADGDLDAKALLDDLGLVYAALEELATHPDGEHLLRTYREGSHRLQIAVVLLAAWPALGERITEALPGPLRAPGTAWVC